MPTPLELVVYDGTLTKRVDCGTVVSVSDNVQVNLSTTPIVTYTAENAFVFDTGATNTYTFTIVRKNPIPGEVINGEVVHEVINGIPNDSGWTCTYEWSNSSWKKAMAAIINRWQAKTNGCKLYYTPIVQVDTETGRRDVFQRRIDGINVYLKSLTFDYTTAAPEVIKANISVTMGSMCGSQRISW